LKKNALRFESTRATGDRSLDMQHQPACGPSTKNCHVVSGPPPPLQPQLGISAHLLTALHWHLTSFLLCSNRTARTLPNPRSKLPILPSLSAPSPHLHPLPSAATYSRLLSGRATGSVVTYDAAASALQVVLHALPQCAQRRAGKHCQAGQPLRPRCFGCAPCS
jgi:hypothetical protein